MVDIRFGEEMEDIESSGEKSELSVIHNNHGNYVLEQHEKNEPLERTNSRQSNVLARVASRITTRSIRDPGPPPDGGFVAWTQIFCAWLAIMNSWGFVNSFGAFQPYYESILPESASTISWIGSVQACLMFSLGILSGRALDRGWFRPTVAIGIAIQLLGIFALSGSHTYWQFLLTQGFCSGVGGGIFFVPIMGLCSTYFSTHRGIAIGIITTGNSLGAVIYPVVVRQLLGKIGFGWTIRVLGFLNVACLLIAIAFMKPRLPPRKSGPIIEWEALKDAPYCLHVLGVCFLMPPVYCVLYYVRFLSSSNACTVANANQVASFARDELGMPYTTSLNLVIILNGVGIPARILPGYIADRYIGVLNVLILSLIINIVVLWAWLSVNSIPGYYAWTVSYGLASAMFQSLFATTIAAYSSDITKTGTRLGMAFAVIGMSALVGGPISGALLQAAHGNYTIPIAWAASSTVVGTALCTTARCMKFGWKLTIKC
jgi:MFS family permease